MCRKCLIRNRSSFFIKVKWSIYGTCVFSFSSYQCVSFCQAIRSKFTLDGPAISVSDPYWTQYGSGSRSSILIQYESGSGSGFGSRFIHDQNGRNFFFKNKNIIFSHNLLWRHCLSINHQTLCKMVNTLFTIKSQFYFTFWAPFWLSLSGSVFPKRIRIQGSHFNSDPHGSGSGYETPPAIIMWRY